jgi:hypothetical protein
MERVLEVVERAKRIFHQRLLELQEQGGMTEEIYVRYLTFQYHLTKGVQRPFLMVAAHPRLAGKRKLREFLFRFGLEEEPHYKVAEIDLQRMGKKPRACPLDVSLWWAYFDQIVLHRPLVRLGATCVLENLGAGAGDLGHHLLDSAPFLNPGNTRFLHIHFHEALPHGDQIVGALQSVTLDEDEIDDLVEGANIGSIFYMRMVDWALSTDPLTTRDFNASSSVARFEDGEYADLAELVAY